MELSLAPMLKVTTPPFRLLIRSLSKKVVLFTELLTEGAINNASEEKIRRILGDPEDGTVVQVGGSDPIKTAAAVKRLSEMGHKNFNLNCGCPSSRVQQGLFGAILMNHKERVTEIVNEVYKQTGLVITVKTRIGVDKNDSYEFFEDFILHIANNSPCKTFYIHSRKCWLKGLDPKANRSVPPLRYEYAYKLKEENPELKIILNGGITIDNHKEALNNLDGIMIGRAAIADILIFNKIAEEKINLQECIKEYLRVVETGDYNKSKIYIPLLNIYKHTPLNKPFKKVLSKGLSDSNSKIKDVNTSIINFITEKK